jgi:molybdate transport system permease protein
MDWPALRVSLSLGVWTVILLLPLGVWAGHQLATRTFRGKAIAEALIAIPLILPPTVLGFYLLVTFSPRSPFGGGSRASSGIRWRSRFPAW